MPASAGKCIHFLPLLFVKNPEIFIFLAYIPSQTDFA